MLGRRFAAVRRPAAGHSNIVAVRRRAGLVTVAGAEFKPWAWLQSGAAAWFPSRTDAPLTEIGFVPGAAGFCT